MRRVCLYLKMAVQNLVNNRRFYLPYSLCCIGTAAMYYIMSDIVTNKTLTFERGSEYVQMMMGMGVFVLSVFSVFIICYANSFIIKRRRRELGLYNILGMEKRHIAILMLFETLLLGVGCIAAGLAGGILFSKLTLLILAQILRFGVPMGFTISLPGIVMTSVQFGVIFLVCLVVNIYQVLRSSPIELLHAVSKGEREPKGRILLALFGIATLGGGYAIALTVKDPVSALMMFFVAVLLVIFGTFSLFTAGSIVILKLLRKNKRLYYQVGPFTAISGLIYRMKQNAVGMANICILSTMVLVTISTTVSLYVGLSDIIGVQYPYEVKASLYLSDYDTGKMASEEMAESFYNETVDAAKTTVQPTSIEDYTHLEFTVLTTEDGKYTVQQANSAPNGSLVGLGLITAEDYNRLTGRSVTLADGEVLSCTNMEVTLDNIEIDGFQFRVVENLPDFPLSNWDALISMNNSQYLVVSDQSVITAMYEHQHEVYGKRASRMLYTVGIEMDADADTRLAAYENVVSRLDNLMSENSFFGYVYGKRASRMLYTVGIEMDADADTRLAAYENVVSRLDNLMSENSFFGYRIDSRQLNLDEMYSMYGSFLFLGIFLGLVFTMAAVLIIYYKQVSEGYDDRERFVIMQKVGMDTRTVKKSIGTQVLMIFFLPLLVAGVHVAVAFPIISQMLQLFALQNTGLFALCVVSTFLIFAVVYVTVYLLTARTYYKIVGDYSRYPAAKPAAR